MQVSKTLLSTLLQLMDGKSVAASSLRKDFAEELIEEGLLTVRAHGSRRTFHAIDTVVLRRFIESRYEELRNALLAEGGISSSVSTRSEQAAETGNSKLVKVRSCPGFPVNAYESINCRLRGQVFVVNPPEGSFVFIDDWQSFEIPEDVVVVGIENLENYRMVRRQRQLFEREIGKNRLLFVSRYPQSTDLRQWLQKIKNRYVHFGDFDLAGIHIFLTEFHKFLAERSSFLVPSDIDQRLAKGSQTRYNDQYAKYHALHTDMPYLQSLIDLINKHHRAYDQEGYISNK